MRVRLLRRSLFTLSLGLVVLTGCFSSPGVSSSANERSGSSDSSGPGEAFPVTITHAYRETTIPAAPKRIAGVGWGPETSYSHSDTRR